MKFSAATIKMLERKGEELERREAARGIRRIMTSATPCVTRRIAGHAIRLKTGTRYVASRPFAQRGREVYPVTIHELDDSGCRLIPDAWVIDGLTYEQANALVNSFNNGKVSWDGRVW